MRTFKIPIYRTMNPTKEFGWIFMDARLLRQDIDDFDDYVKEGKPCLLFRPRRTLYPEKTMFIWELWMRPDKTLIIKGGSGILSSAVLTPTMLTAGAI